MILGVPKNFTYKPLLLPFIWSPVRDSVCLNSHNYIFFLLVLFSQVVEIFHKGNLEEFPVQSLFHAWLYASQLSSALEYLETKKLVHTSVVEPFVYIASAEKVCEYLLPTKYDRCSVDYDLCFVS